MFREQKSFSLRFNLEATFPDEYDGDDDNHAWLQEWEKHIKPELLKQIFETLRRRLIWNVHVRNRGISPQDEIEIAIERDFSQPSSTLH